MKKHGFWDRLKYRFDTMMAKGNASMIKMLLIATLLIVLVITLALHFATPADERDLGGSFWDALASAVNAWMPYSDDGSLAYILLTALAACTGLLFTSILIGIISSAVEEKVTGLREGNSAVLEKGHIVVLGFIPGEYTLLRQLIAAARGNKTCILVVSEQPRSETMDSIRENVEIPKNVKLLCRCAAAGDVAALRVCSIPDCRTVVINQPDDASTVKSALAAYRLLSESGRTDVKIVSNVAGEDYLLPRELAADMNLINVSVSEVIARVIAHSCTETGIAKAYVDLFDIEGGGVRLLRLPGAAGKTFGDAVRTLDGAVPLGICADGKTLLNPPAGRVIGQNDRLICWAEDGREPRFGQAAEKETAYTPPAAGNDVETTLVLGDSPAFETLLRELPECGNRVAAVGISAERRQALLAVSREREDVELSFFAGGLSGEALSEELLSGVRHVVILADPEVGENDAIGILRYLRVNDVKKRRGLDFSVTLELESEKNLSLIAADGETDFIVAPYIVSMFLAQIADCPDVAGVFAELLSNAGSEIHLKPAAFPADAGAVTCASLRAGLLKEKMILLGYIAEGKTVLNPALDAPMPLSALSQLIVISET